MPSRKYVSGGIPGIPSAPLIRETLSAIDYDFMKIKQQLGKEFPTLTFEELIQEMRKDVSPIQLLLLSLVAMGYQKSANEIIKLMREEGNVRHSTTESKNCEKIPRLSRDLQKMKMLAVVFSECEEWEKRDGFWRDILLARIHLAQLFHEMGDAWLAGKIIHGCSDYFEFLNKDDKLDRNMIADINLITAFLLTEETGLNKDEEHQLSAIDNLIECRRLTEDNQERKGHYYEQILHKEEVHCYDLVKIRLDRPIATHGWKNYKAVVATEIVKASEESTFRAGSILWSKILVNIANETIRSVESGEAILEEDSPIRIYETVDRLFIQAFELALEGHNVTNILCVLYNHAKFLLDIGDIDKAREMFLKLHFRSMLFEDYETVGLSFSGLGSISDINNHIDDALGHFCNEWEIGREKHFPALVIDSTRCMGKILLEEGQLVDAERCCRESYDKHVRLRQKDANRIAHPNDEDELYDTSWAMVGIAAGQALWGKFASLARIGNRNQSLLEWKSYRKPLPRVLQKPFKPKTIIQNKRHVDVKRIARRLEHIENSKEAEIIPLTEAELEKEWTTLVKHDSHEFKHDVDVHAYRERVIASTHRFNISLSIAMLHQKKNLPHEHLAKIFTSNVRSMHIKTIVSEKLREQRLNAKKVSRARLDHHERHEDLHHEKLHPDEHNHDTSHPAHDPLRLSILHHSVSPHFASFRKSDHVHV